MAELAKQVVTCFKTQNDVIIILDIDNCVCISKRKLPYTPKSTGESPVVTIFQFYKEQNETHN